MGGKKKKGRSDPDQDWEAELEAGALTGEAEGVVAPTPVASGKKGKKKKGFADLDDEDLEAMEAEILRGEPPPAAKAEESEKVTSNSEGSEKSGNIDGSGKGEQAIVNSGSEDKGSRVSKKAKKKKKKGGIEDEVEAALREIEGDSQPAHLPAGTTPEPAASSTTAPKKPTEPAKPVFKSTSDQPEIKTPESSTTMAKRSENVPHEASGDVEAGEGGEAGEGEASKDKKKKKKKKAKEEEKKPAKKSGKSVPVAMIKKLQAAREEEERLRREEELRLQREEEEREQKRLEKLRLEQERKERLKQKERERKQRRKAEGKPVTKKEREAEARRQAQLAALREQGIEVPDKAGTGERKKVVYGSRQRGNKKNRPQQDDVENIPEKQIETLESPVSETVTNTAETVESAAQVPAEEDDDDTLDNWEDMESEEELESKQPEEVESVKTSVGVEGESSAEESDSETESSSEEESEEGEEDADLSPYDRAKRRIELRRQEAEAGRSEEDLRSPVVCVLGHVDTGKTKILDKIRKTNVQDGEAGGITQQIGATFVPLDSVKEQTKMLKEFSKVTIKLPGLLIIDTPGHESFNNLRTRGSSLCDIAILVVDLMHGLEPQTLESINILMRRKTPFIVALNKIDRLFDWQRNPNSGVRETLKRQKANTRDQFDERVKLAVRQFAEKELNVALFWEKVDFSEYIPMVPTSAITGDGMGDLIALIVTYSQKLLTKQLMLSNEVEAVVMEVKVISGLGTTVDVILRNGELKEGDTIVLTGIDGPFVTSIRALLMPQPLRELRVKNAYLSPSKVLAAQGVKITAKGELDKTVAGTPLFVAHQQDEVEVLKDEASQALKSALSAIKLQERGVYVQASTVGSLEALLEFLKQSKIPYCGVNIGPVHKRDVMKASVMLEHDSQWAVILAFDVKVERDAQEMADSVGVKIFTADIIYHLFDSFLKHRQEYRDQKRKEYENIAVFPCKLRVLPNCVFNTRDPIIVGVIVEAGIIKPGTPLTVPSKNFTDIGVVSSLELNHKNVDIARQGSEVCIRVESTGDAPRLYGRHFDHTDQLVSKISRESIDAVKNYFREDMHASDWQLIIELKKTFGII